MSSALISNMRILLFAFLCALPQRAFPQNNLYVIPSAQAQNPAGSCIISADLLVWYASEEVSSIWADVVTTGANTATWFAPSFKFKWDDGFRLGVGYNFAYDAWDTKLTWTWYHTDASHTVPRMRNTIMHPEFFAGFLSGDTPQTMTVKWSLLFNMFDWELGRSFWASKDLSLRPFIGIKGGWIHQSIAGKYSDLTIDLIFATDNSAQEHLKNNFWGIGPATGMNTKWRAGNFGSHFFSFFGDFSAATMWGRWTVSDRYKSTVPKTSSVNTKNAMLGALMFRGCAGIGWDVTFGSSRFSTQLGFEMQLWLNQLRIATFQLQRLHDDLTLHGLTWHCQFDF